MPSQCRFSGHSQQENAMETITATPTLPTSWQPTDSACVSSSDYWLWDYGSDSDRWVVLGGPLQTTECLPTLWASNVVYSGVQCPQKYSSACQGTDSHSQVTCCPMYFKIPPLIYAVEKVLTNCFHTTGSTALLASIRSRPVLIRPCFSVRLHGMGLQHSTCPALNLTGILPLKQ